MLAVNLFQDETYNTCLSYAQNEEDAEEIAQDVFLNIYRSASKFKSNSSISTWIYRITVNRCLDFLRKKNTNKRSTVFTSLYKRDSVEVVFNPTDFNHPGISMENKESAGYLFKVIDTLPETQKTAFILTNIEDLSQQEAADIMKTSRKAVESLLQRAKTNLRKGLEDYFPERGITKKTTSK